MVDGGEGAETYASSPQATLYKPVHKAPEIPGFTFNKNKTKGFKKLW